MLIHFMAEHALCTTKVTLVCLKLMAWDISIFLGNMFKQVSFACLNDSTIETDVFTVVHNNMAEVAFSIIVALIPFELKAERKVK